MKPSIDPAIFSDRQTRDDDIRARALELNDNGTFDVLPSDVRPNPSFQEFFQMVVREMCRGIGLPADGIRARV